MPLVPKISVAAIDTIEGKTITLQDTTGAYNGSSNPGGYGAPNFATTDVDYALVRLRHYDSETYTTKKINSITNLLGAGETIDGLDEGVFLDGVSEVKYYPVIANPEGGSTITTVTWTNGSKTFALVNASTVLAGVRAIILSGYDQTKLFFLDPNIPPTSNAATVTEQLPAGGTSPLALTYEADTRFLMTAAADDCIAKENDRVVKDCSCFNEDMQHVILMFGKREGADLHFAKKNYQAAHEIITQLAAYCDNSLKCGCR